tara:strand:- start:6592 stop:6948 length:357 start_codon:yes stop_codon:yes gene_type:complete
MTSIKKKNLRHFRFVNQKDIVTSVPYLYFYHVGNCILINKNNSMNYTKYNEHNDKSNIFYYFNPLDHLIDNYYNNLVICKWNNNNIYCENYKSSTKAEIVSEENIELTEKKAPQNELI